jgi:hypothetical protein
MTWGNQFRQRPRSNRPKPVQHESAEQCAVIAWARYHEKKWPELRLLYAIPNGHGVHIAIRQKMIREGLLTGIPDLCLPVARGDGHALYIELKWGKNKLSPEQKAVGMMLADANNFVFVAYNHEQACQILVDYITGKEPPKAFRLGAHL